MIKRSIDGNFDLIVMGSSGIGFKRQILGSTSLKVINGIETPVLIVK